MAYILSPVKIILNSKIRMKPPLVQEAKIPTPLEPLHFARVGLQVATYYRQHRPIWGELTRPSIDVCKAEMGRGWSLYQFMQSQNQVIKFGNGGAELDIKNCGPRLLHLLTKKVTIPARSVVTQLESK